MKKLSILIVAVLVLGAVNITRADSKGDKKSASHGLNISIPTHAMIALAGQGNMDIDFEAVAAETAGGKVNFVQTNSTKLWLNYSSIVSSSKENSISAEVSDLPEGLEIEVEVSTSAASGKKGHTGTGSTKKLSSNGVKVVDDIKSCYTGSGENKGHSLVYKVKAVDSDYDKIVAESHNLTITYTITEN